MSDDEKVCGKAHPQLELQCGLYAWHRQDGTPHRILRRDYPYNKMVKRSAVIEWWDRVEAPR